VKDGEKGLIALAVVGGYLYWSKQEATRNLGWYGPSQKDNSKGLVLHRGTKAWTCRIGSQMGSCTQRGVRRMGKST